MHTERSGESDDEEDVVQTTVPLVPLGIVVVTYLPPIPKHEQVDQPVQSSVEENL